MFRALLRAILILVVIVGIGALFIGYELGEPDIDVDREPIVGTSGATGDSPGVSVDRARDAGAAVGGAVATGANEAGRLLSTAALTAKIKSKMALDDTIEARAIDVDSASGGVVTLSGSVASEAARARALQLAMETEGVTDVIDRLQVR
jgi:osmotically-inducible protein OsmY